MAPAPPTEVPFLAPLESVPAASILAPLVTSPSPPEELVLPLKGSVIVKAIWVRNEFRY